jgi:dihydrodipicolinate synthase/N-acetylneuraminate lyase
VAGVEETLKFYKALGYDGVFITNHFIDGNINEAVKLQEEIDIIIAALCKCGVMQGEKTILNAQGINFGAARSPFAPLSAEAQKQLLDTVLPLL